MMYQELLNDKNKALEIISSLSDKDIKKEQSKKVLQTKKKFNRLVNTRVEMESRAFNSLKF